MKLIGFIQLLVSLYVGINGGSSNAQSPGGKVVLSIVYVIGMVILFIIVDLVLAWLASLVRGDFRSSRSYGSTSGFATKASQEDALEALAERSRRKQEAVARGESPSAIDAEEAERLRSEANERQKAFQQRIKDADGIVWPEG